MKKVKLQVSNIKKSYGTQDVLEKASLTIKEKEKIALVGKNGCGKTTLLKILCKEETPDQGSIIWANGVQVGYLAQITFSQTDHTVFEELQTAFDKVRQIEQQLHQQAKILASDSSEKQMEKYASLQSQFEALNGYQYEVEMRNVFFHFGFTEEDLHKDLQSFSSGQRTRIALVKLLLSKPDVLLLDEPTNHLDIDSREVLESAINEFPGTVLFVSHDRYFINQVATDILDMRKDGIKHYEGDYDDYLATVAKAAAPNPVSPAQSSPAASQGKQSYQQSKDQQRARRKLQRKVDDLEKQMAQLEDQQAAIETEMSKPEVATDIGKLTDLQKELDQLKAQSEEVELDWTAAAEELEKFDQENQL